MHILTLQNVKIGFHCSILQWEPELMFSDFYQVQWEPVFSVFSLLRGCVKTEGLRPVSAMKTCSMFDGFLVKAMGTCFSF